MKFFHRHKWEEIKRDTSEVLVDEDVVYNESTHHSTVQHRRGVVSIFSRCKDAGCRRVSVKRVILRY